MLTYLEKRNHSAYQSPYLKDNIGKYWIRSTNSLIYLQCPEFKFVRKTNSLGISENEIPAEKSSNEYRIIGLGDSFTEGDGADFDSTWVRFLERSIVSKYPGREIKCFNAGVCGSDPIFEYYLLKDKLVQLRPDLIILAINNSDIQDIVLRGGFERILPDGSVHFKKAPFFESLYIHSHLFRLIIHNLFRYNKSLISPGDFKTEIRKAQLNIINAIKLTIDLGKKNNFKVLIVLHPNRQEIYYNQWTDLKCIVQYLYLNHVYFLDMLDYYYKMERINQLNFQRYFWKQDGHHNSLGYAAFARGVEWKLEINSIIK